MGCGGGDGITGDNNSGTRMSQVITVGTSQSLPLKSLFQATVSITKLYVYSNTAMQSASITVLHKIHQHFSIPIPYSCYPHNQRKAA